MKQDKLDFKVDLSDFEDLAKKLEQGVSPKASAALYILLETMGKKMENYARTRSIWQNRTGDARRYLTGGALADKDSISAFVSHGVWYGIYLELAMQRKYAILEKAVKAYEKETTQNIIEFLQKIK